MTRRMKTHREPVQEEQPDTSASINGDLVEATERLSTSVDEYAQLLDQIEAIEADYTQAIHHEQTLHIVVPKFDWFRKMSNYRLSIGNKIVNTDVHETHNLITLTATIPIYDGPLDRTVVLLFDVDDGSYSPTAYLDELSGKDLQGS